MLRSPTEWFSDSLDIGLEPDQITLAYRRHGWRPIDTTHLSLSIAPTEADRRAWQYALTELDRWLNETKLQRAASRLILSNQWIRIAMLPWSDEPMNAAEENMIARACLDAHYDNNEAWTISIDRASFGEPRLVVAIETELIDAIRELFERHKLRCKFVLPMFVSAWNRWRSCIKVPEAMFAVADSSLVFMATCKEGKWHSARTIRMTADSDSLTDLLTRESILQGFATVPPIWLVADGDPGQFRGVPGIRVLAGQGEKL